MSVRAALATAAANLAEGKAGDRRGRDSLLLPLRGLSQSTAVSELAPIRAGRLLILLPLPESRSQSPSSSPTSLSACSGGAAGPGSGAGAALGTPSIATVARHGARAPPAWLLQTSSGAAGVREHV